MVVFRRRDLIANHEWTGTNLIGTPFFLKQKGHISPCYFTNPRVGLALFSPLIFCVRMFGTVTTLTFISFISLDIVDAERLNFRDISA